MRLRRPYVLLAAPLGLAAAMLPAIASSETSPTVDAVNSGLYSHSWSPSQVSVAAGGVVSVRNPTTIRHGIEWVGGPAKPTCDPSVPVGTTEAASGTEWSGNCTFAQAGSYTFYCTVHGPEMTGVVTVSASGVTTVTTTTSPTTTTGTTVPSPKPETPSGSPLLGRPKLSPVQRGASVHGSIEVSRAGAGDRLQVDLSASRASLANAKRGARVSAGRLTRSSVRAGQQSFTVKLNTKARHALSRRRRLALTVRITLTPFYGEPTTVTRAVVLHAR